MNAISLLMNIITPLSILALFLLTAAPNNAALTPISPLDFPAGAVVLDFSGLTDGTEVNGLVFDGVPFQVTKNGSPTNGIVVIDGGPGITGHISPPNLVSISDLDGVALGISLPNLATKFGYGYALRSENTVPAATTINLFAGITPIGSITFTGTPDPLFTGGFAGVASDTPFDRAVLTFSDIGDAFAVDNVTFASSVSEQEATLILFSTGIFAILCLRAIHGASVAYRR
jgi:hypothetical protein